MTKRIVFDTELRRPACVLIQAAMGGDTGIANRFPSETWLIYPTPAMAVFPVTDEQIPKLIAMAVAAVKDQQ